MLHNGRTFFLHEASVSDKMDWLAWPKFGRMILTMSIFLKLFLVNISLWDQDWEDHGPYSPWGFFLFPAPQCKLVPAMIMWSLWMHSIHTVGIPLVLLTSEHLCWAGRDSSSFHLIVILSGRELEPGLQGFTWKILQLFIGPVWTFLWVKDRFKMLVLRLLKSSKFTRAAILENK